MLKLENSEPTALERGLLEHKPGEPDRSQLDPWLRMVFPEPQITWAQVLGLENEGEPLHPILFTAPSGSGKSTELHFLADRLRRDGKTALALEGSRLAAGELEKVLGPDELEAWKDWKSRPLEARPCIYLLIDAVDELYLGRRNLQDLWAEMRAKELLEPTVRLVVSSRDDTWGPEESQWLREVSAALCATSGTSEAGPNDGVEMEPFLGDTSRGVARRAVETSAPQAEEELPSSFRHIKLAFLAPEEVLVLATSFGLEQDEREGFRAALKAAEIEDLFPFRPRDVKTLVGYWHAHHSFYSWTDVLEWQVRNAYQELNPERGRHKELSLERYTEGIRRIAVVTTFSGVKHVLRPDSLTVKGAPHAEDLFPEWKPGELMELFASPLLVRKGPASQDNTGVAVQIVQGQLADYLTAHWAKGLYFGGAEEAILKSLFVVPPQHEVECVPEDRRGVAGWLSGMLPQVRRRLMGIAPEVALYRGDPACLSVDEVRQALEAVLQRPPVGRHEYGSTGQFARIARPELSAAVVNALAKQGLPDHLAHELLQIAREGAFRGSVAPALDWAMNEDAEEYTRKRAVELVAELGTKEERRKLLALLGTDAPPVRVALFRALVPQYLFGEELVEFLARENKGDIIYEIRKQELPLSPAELCRLVGVLTARLLKGTRPGSPDCIYEEAEDGTALLSLELLKIRARDPRPLEREFCELAIRIDSRELDVFIGGERESAIKEALCLHHWESIWEARLHHEPLWSQRFKLCPIESSRFDWVTEKLTTLGSGPVYDHLRMWGTGFLERLPDDGLAQLKSIASPASCEVIERWEQNRVQHQEEIRFHENERQRENADKRDENDAALRPHLERIRRGDHEGALHWGYQYFPEASFHRAGKLHEVASADVAQALTEGFRNWWRKSEPSPDSTKTTYGEAWGVVGVSLEISAQGLKGIQSDKEVRVATLLALRELNSVPAWLKDLHAQHPLLVEDTLRQAVLGAWGIKSGRTSFISHLYRLGASKLIDSIARELFTLLGEVVPASASTLEDAIDLVLRASTPPEWLSVVAAHWTKKATSPEFRKQWLRLWCHSGGGAAAKWLLEARKADRSWDQVIQSVCERLHWDLDRDNPAKWSVFFSTESLRCWLPLLVELAPEETKLRRPGRRAIARTWTAVDHTREVLHACQNYLVADGSVQGTNALNELTAYPDHRVSAWAKEMLPFQRLNAVKLAQEVWDVEKIIEAERFACRVPLTTAELCDVVLGEIRRIDSSMREGDFAYPEFFTSDLSENDIQRWVAAQLELVGRRTFSVARESEVKDGNEMDIVAVRPSLGRVPIEIKPIFDGTDYSIPKLEKTIDEQLVGKYMKPREVTHGVLLLVRLVPKRWQLDGQLVDFATAVDHLTVCARAHERSGKTVAVAVIDM